VLSEKKPEKYAMVSVEKAPINMSQTNKKPLFKLRVKTINDNKNVI